MRRTAESPALEARGGAGGDRRTAWGLDGVSVRYGRRQALRDVTLQVRRGEVTAVIGGDGAGKTTLLRALAGAAPLAAGAVRRPDRRRIGYVSGAGGLYLDLSVDENIAFTAAAYGLRGRTLSERRALLLERTGLQGTGERLASRLSGGMRQKLAVALAMLHEPDLLILDEPTTGVDPVSRAELWRLIAGAAAGGAGVLVTTTYLDEARRAAHVALLDAGRIAAAGPDGAAESAATGGAGSPGPADGAGPDVTGAPPSTAGGMETAGPPLAATRAVSRRFGSLTAVDSVDLEVRSGEIVGLLGANGAGKTTLIRMLLGLLAPSDGSAELFGAAPSRAARRRIGYLPQGLGLWVDLTVAENLAFSSRAFAMEPPPLDDDLAAARGVLVRDLPLGLRRRLAFAAALAHGPELLVLDEPTSGVDPAGRARLWETIHAAVGRGPAGRDTLAPDRRAGALVTTHHLDEADQCDRLVFLARGRVVAAGTKSGIVGGRRAVLVETEHWPQAYAALEQAGLPTALVGADLRVAAEEDAAGQALRVRDVLAAAGVQAAVELVPATLEETFVTLARPAASGV